MRSASLQRAGLALFLEHGVEAVTIDQIVDRAQTAKGSFYRYFTDKTALVGALVEPVQAAVLATFDACATELEAATDGGLARPYEALAQGLIRVVLENPEVVRLYLQESRGPKSGARAPIVAMSEAVLDAATRLSNIAHGHGLVRGLAGRLSAIVVVGAAELVVARLFAGDDVGPVLEMPLELVSLVLDGVRAKRAPKAAKGASLRRSAKAVKGSKPANAANRGKPAKAAKASKGRKASAPSPSAKRSLPSRARST